MATETTPWDPAERLTSPAAIAAYLEAVFEDGDPGLIAAALGDVACARHGPSRARRRRHPRRALQGADQGWRPAAQHLPGRREGARVEDTGGGVGGRASGCT
jgi:hypothetical protein